MLLPDMPAAVGTGGQVRAYHFARALAQVAEVSACILVDRGNAMVPADLERACRALFQPDAGLYAESQPRRRIGSSLLRALSVLVAPWRQGGRQLMIAGNVNCVVRSENLNGHHLGWFHALYAALLLAEAGLCRQLFNIFPPDTLVRSGEFAAILPNIFKEWQDREPDVIWCEHSYLYPVAEQLHNHFPRASLIINAHNVEWVLKQGISQTKKSELARRWVLTEAAILRRWEKRMLLRAELVFCCSEPDAKRFRELAPDAHAQIKIIPNGVDTEHFRPTSENSDLQTLLFTGTASYPPNDDAVTWLVTLIYPLIRQKVPECRLCLAGRNAGAQWGHFADGDPQIEVASDVPDMRPWFGKSTVCVVPLRSGSGTRLKILEAMSMGRAVVSTNLGAEGIEAIPGTHLLIADTSEAFADAVVRVLRNDDKRHSLEQAGRTLVRERYEWSSLMRNAIGSLIEIGPP